jgi:hypothetical protein
MGELWRSDSAFQADVLYSTTQHVPKGDLAEDNIYPESYPYFDCQAEPQKCLESSQAISAINSQKFV